jgi:uncharacterized protein (DUF433 family)
MRKIASVLKWERDVRLAASALQGIWVDCGGPATPGGKLAVRGTRLSVSLIPECLAGGMSLQDIDEAFDYAFPHEALPELLKVASELTGSFHVAA